MPGRPDPSVRTEGGGAHGSAEVAPRWYEAPLCKLSGRDGKIPIRATKQENENNDDRNC